LAYILRLYTPVGQVNDYVAHPAFHTLRNGELVITATDMETRASTNVPYSYLRLAELVMPHGNYDDFVRDYNKFSGGSIYVAHRYKSTRGDIYLGAAEVQEAKVVERIEEDPDLKPLLLGVWDDKATNYRRSLPRGIYLAHSGGMRSEVLLLAPVGNRAMIRGVCVCETLGPTIGRKSVVADQRHAVSRAAAGIFSQYDQSVRQRLKGATRTGPSLKAFVERRNLLQETIQVLSKKPPQANDIHVWAGDDSREARVMCLYSELIGRGLAGDLNILKVFLPDQYDFLFLYRSLLTPKSTHPTTNTAMSRKSVYGGNVTKIDGRDHYYQYGVGEFKHEGSDLIGDFESKVKDPNLVDLLVCWEFDPDVLDEAGWESKEVTDATRIFVGETHQWTSESRTVGFPVSVVCLSRVVESLLKAGKLSKWDTKLPDLYI